MTTTAIPTTPTLAEDHPSTFPMIQPQGSIVSCLSDVNNNHSDHVDGNYIKDNLIKQGTTTTTMLDNETIATANCDDSMTASVWSLSTRGSPTGMVPPVDAVNIKMEARKSVRQRLRDQEAKINALLHANVAKAAHQQEQKRNEDGKHHQQQQKKQQLQSPSEGILLKLVKTLEDDLKKTEDEKQQLQNELKGLKQQQQIQQKVIDSKQQEEKAFECKAETVEEVDNVSEKVSPQERIAALELELETKANEVSLLRDRWETTLQRMVTYQCDLELHDLHYTQYAAQQANAAEDALKEMRELTQKDQPKQTRQLGKQAKNMMSTLLHDLENLGERYQASRVAQEQQVAHLQQQQALWQRRAESLEEVLMQNGIAPAEPSSNVPGATTSTPAMSGPLMSFHHKLRLQQGAAQQRQEQLQHDVAAEQWKHEQTKLEKEVLQQEVDRLNATVAQLQSTSNQQHEALVTAQSQAQAAATALQELQEAGASKKKKRFGLFGKKNKSPAALTVEIPIVPDVDLVAAWQPAAHESQRFETLQDRLSQQTRALNQMLSQYNQQVQQKSQLQQAVQTLRVEQATQETDLQQQLVVLQTQRDQEQRQAQVTIAALQARLKEAGLE